MHYWRWFFRLHAGATGWRRFLDWWLLFHCLTAAAMALWVRADLREASNAVLLPLAGVLIGLCFAWGGNAQTLLQTDEIELLAKHRPGGIREYVYVYQTAILVVMASLVLWGIAGLGVFDDTWPTGGRPGMYLCTKWFLFFTASVTLRECWHVVLGAQSLLVLRATIRDKREKAQTPPGEKQD